MLTLKVYRDKSALSIYEGSEISVYRRKEELPEDGLPFPVGGIAMIQLRDSSIGWVPVMEGDMAYVVNAAGNTIETIRGRE